jgi:predicted Fe-S protein YdhL (DUF1289 family)
LTSGARNNRRTPCVGICSTTYGDLVCRGCKRFAHEIVQWNGYDDLQKDAIWTRLHALRDEVVSQRIAVANETIFAQTCGQARLDELDGQARIYALVSHLVVTSATDIAEGGLRWLAGGTPDARSVIQALDAEIYDRSIAHYEHSYKVPV